MDDSKKVRNKTYKRVDENVVKIEVKPEIESAQSFNSENIGLNFVEVPSIEEHYSDSIAKPKLRRKPHKRLQSLILPKQDYPTNLKLTLKKKRFRPIRPKPSQNFSPSSRHKFELPMMKVTTLPSNHVFVSSTVPIKKNFRCIAPSNVFNEMNNIGSNSKNISSNNINCINSNIINNNDNNKIVNIQSATEKDKIDKTQKSNTTANSSCNNNSNRSNNSNSNVSNNSNNNSSSSNNSSYRDCSKDAKTISKSHKNSIELFFESMAQTVLYLPNEVQASIKMQICKIVTMAEIRHCASKATSTSKH